jgi:hypothetical protein
LLGDIPGLLGVGLSCHCPLAEAFWEWEPSQAAAFLGCGAFPGPGCWRFALMMRPE